MIRNYSNNKIYKNFTVVKILSIIAIIFALAGLTIDVIIIINLRLEVEIMQFISYHIFSFGFPFAQFSITNKPHGLKKETQLNNDYSILIAIIVISLLPIAFYPLLKLSDDNLVYLPNILILISDGFLIHNCVLIKREWNNNPPEFYREKQSQIVQKRNMEQYKILIEKCGIKFFIKYYNQINRLPLRDVTISENYSSTEREERLLAAKKIIDLGLTEFTLKEILNTYSDVLDETEITEAKSLLSKMQDSINSQQSVNVHNEISIPKKQHQSFKDDWDN